ncbi:hypothetical protein ACZ87_02666 [Candidatus Erwinia dacicola]|uniref:Transposase n=1 Tax=Candidatus Erwinia dacicola TaxID=252393 RepID=A0A328TJ79_9GAMM|nr:hypothetical protein ACZ87_02666 [Candidatus Erwinia dacicola]
MNSKYLSRSFYTIMSGKVMLNDFSPKLYRVLRHYCGPMKLI